jgi:hypothetical protein
MADRRSGHGRPGKPVVGHGVASLVGGGPSLVGPVGAMRARDVARPRDTDYARAEKTVVVRRRPADAPAPPVQSSAGASEPVDS